MKRLIRVALGSSALVALSFSQGCATDRPARNGVFNENQYVRKDFLTQKADGSSGDPGWVFRATVTETSTPNVLGSAISVWGGYQGPVDIVHFRVSQDKLQMTSARKFSNVDPTATTPAVVNVWPAANVDLKYRVNLDGERTNFFEENQEQDWQNRQYLKINFARNDFSDFAALDYMGSASDILNKCADIGNASATLVDGSLQTEGQETADLGDDYLAFTVQAAVPMRFDDTTCIAAYGPMVDNAVRLGRSTVTVNIKYSFKRSMPSTYKPFPIDEKDPIHRKYGPFIFTGWNRDPASTLIAAQEYVGRFDPAKPIVWTFDPAFPPQYKKLFTDPGGIVDKTNDIFAKAGNAGRLVVQEKPDGVSYGDIRYNFIRWISDEDMQDSFAGVNQPGFDPRSGEIINSSIEVNDFAVRDYYVQRIDAFLESIASDKTADGKSVSAFDTGGTCTDGQTKPIINKTLVNKHNSTSTVFAKMQTYLGAHTTDPAGDHLGVQDMIQQQDADFMKAYFALAPYQLFADPAANQFVTPEGGTGVYGSAALWKGLQDSVKFNDLMAKVNRGETPFTATEGTSGVLAAADFMNQVRDLGKARRQLDRVKMMQSRNLHMDAPDAFSLETVMLKDSLRCIGGKWETKEQWTQAIIDGYWTQVIWHEFGHGLGLEHNFMGSIDQHNFAPIYAADGTTPATDALGNVRYSSYSSSIMEYNAAPDRLWWIPQWGAYDKGALAWIYANDGATPATCATDTDCKTTGAHCDSNKLVCVNKTVSGQLSATSPYKDPMGVHDKDAADGSYKAGDEIQFLRCSEEHLAYSPLCRQGDLGVTPSQIIANAVDMYEWQFPFRNFRSYHKTFNFQNYAATANAFFTDMRRFLAMWAFDWGSGEIKDTLHKIGVVPPPDAPSAQNYYDQLANKFTNEMSTTNKIIASFTQAVVAQGSSQRPFATTFDKFYGDEVQQGIIIDKLIATTGWVGLWQTDNYDQNQAGVLFSSFAIGFDPSYQAVAEAGANFMVGGNPAAYAYFSPATVALFAQDTHNPTFLQLWSFYRTEVKDWIGGWTFYRQVDMIDFFKNIAVGAGKCTSFSTCTYNVTDPAQTNADANTGEFIGPDGLHYNFMLIPSRNTWVVARKDRHVATWGQILQYNNSFLGQHEDGTNAGYALEYGVKSMIDSYTTYEK